MSNESLQLHVSEQISVYLCGITGKCLLTVQPPVTKPVVDDDDDNSSGKEPKHSLDLPPMPPLFPLATAAAAGGTPVAVPANSIEPPPHVKWVHRATLAVDSFFPMKDLPVMSGSKKTMLDHVHNKVKGSIQWLAMGAVLLLLGKMTPEDKAKWVEKHAAAMPAIEKCKEIIADSCKKKKGADSMFHQGPPEDWLLNEFFPHFPGLEIAVVRTANLAYLRGAKTAPYYESVYSSESAIWIRNIGIGILFYAFPYFLLILQGVVPVELVPQDPAVRDAEMAAVMPEEIPSTDNSDIMFGYKDGKAPRLPHKGTVCVVTQATVKQCFGIEPVLQQYYQSENPLPGADTLPYVDIATTEGDFNEYKCKDVCAVSWPAFRKILSWYGGGPFVGLTLIVDDKASTVAIARPVTFKLFAPDPSKCTSHDAVYCLFELKTRSTDMTVIEAIRACLQDGGSVYHDTRTAYTKNHDPEKFDEGKVVLEAKEYILKLVEEQYKLDKLAIAAAAAADALDKEKMEQQNSQDGAPPAATSSSSISSSSSSSAPAAKKKKAVRSSEHRLIEITTGEKVNAYDGVSVKDLEAPARIALSARTSSYSSGDKTSISFVVFESGTADQYGEKRSSTSYGSYGSYSYGGGGGGSTHPGWVGLQNLGNTCFMNAALQCLAHAKPFVDRMLAVTDADFPDGKPPEGASFVLIWKDLLDNMWNKADQQRSFSPDALKKAVGKRYPRYAGYEQQDSIEFVATWVDSLHEELNPRAKGKKYRERSSRDAGVPVKELSSLYWEDARENNKSFVFDQWYGQMHSDIQCMACGHTTTIFDPFSCLPVSLKEMETVPFDVPVFFISSAGPASAITPPESTPSPSSTTSKDSSTTTTTTNSNSSFASAEAEEGVDPKMPRVHQLMIRIRITKGSSVRDVQKEIFNTLDGDAQAQRMGLKMRAWQEVSVVRFASYNKTVYATSPIDRVTDYHDYVGFVSSSNFEVRRVIEDYTTQYNDYTKELRDDEEKRKREEKESKDKKDKEAKEAKEAGAVAPTTAPATDAAVATDAASSAADNNNSNNKNKDDDDDNKKKEAKNKDNNNNNDDDDDDVSKAPVTSSGRRKPKEPLFHIMLVKIEPSSDHGSANARLARDLALPVVVPAKATHKELYTAVVNTASYFLAPTAATVPHPSKSAECFHVTAHAANSWESNKSVSADDDKNTFCPNGGKTPKKKDAASSSSSYYTSSFYSSTQSGPTLYGIGFDKGAVELRNIVLTYDSSKYKAVLPIVAKHTSLDKVPGSGWKAPPVTLEKCIADSAMPQELTGNDQFYCPACKQHQDARKTETVMRLPPLLCVHLKRFHLNYETFTYSKNNTSVPYPDELDVASVVSNVVKQSGLSTKYRLFGTVHHSGSLSFGHYTATVAGEKPLDDPAEAAKEEEAKKKKKEEEEAEEARKNKEADGAGSSSSKGDSVSSSKSSPAAIPKKIHFKDPDAMIARLHAKIEAEAAAKKKAEEEELAAKLKAAQGASATAAAAAEEEAARKKREHDAKEAEEAAAAAKKKKKRAVKRVWLDANDSWVSEVEDSKAQNHTTVYVLFYERIDAPAEGAAAAGDDE